MQWPQSWKETSIRNTCRMTGRSKGAVLSLLVELGCACSALHNCTVRNLKVRRLQADEIWSFVGAKNEECNARAEARGLGRCLDVDCNRCRHSSVSATYWAGEMQDGRMISSKDCASRINGCVQVTTDSHRAYLDAVEGAFGMM